LGKRSARWSALNVSTQYPVASTQKNLGSSKRLIEPRKWFEKRSFLTILGRG
jgi:hypothetical protein